jgi:phosphohistidine phosphatase SixA
MLVGHNPHLSLLVRSLTGIAAAGLRTGQAAHVELDGDRARLIDLLRMPE